MRTLESVASCPPPDLPRVKRTLRAGAPGTLRLRLMHGKTLVCVRHRESADGRERWTTVELIVDRRPSPKRLVRIVVDGRETQLHDTLRNHGAIWDSRQRWWLVELRTARRLKLLNRILGYANET